MKRPIERCQSLQKLSDNQVGDLLEELRLRVEGLEAQTLRGDTTLRATYRAIMLLQAGLVLAEMKDQEINPVIIDPKKLPPSPSRERRRR